MNPTALDPMCNDLSCYRHEAAQTTGQKMMLETILLLTFVVVGALFALIIEFLTAV